jgi:hypothetical protein
MSTEPVEVLCFDTLLQVLILKELEQRKRRKIRRAEDDDPSRLRVIPALVSTGLLHSEGPALYRNCAGAAAQNAIQENGAPGGAKAKNASRDDGITTLRRGLIQGLRYTDDNSLSTKELGHENGSRSGSVSDYGVIRALLNSEGRGFGWKGFSTAIPRFGLMWGC